MSSLFDPVEEAQQLLRVEYLTVPTLLLTPGEAAERLALDRPAALAALQALETVGFLELTPGGQFGRSPDRPAVGRVPSTAAITARLRKLPHARKVCHRVP